MPLSPEDRREIAGRAATVFERAGALGADTAPVRPDAAAHAALSRWQRVFAPADPAAFARRLGWDGLDEARALEAIAAPVDPTALEPAHWTVWLDRIVDEAAGVAADLRDGRLPSASPGDAHPFEELRVPFRRAGRRELLRAVSRAPAHASGATPLEVVDPCIFGHLQAQLDLEIVRTAELAWYERFERDRFAAGASAAPDSGSSSIYRAFVLGLLEGGLSAFFRDYAWLARQLATILARWVEASAELLIAVRDDRARLCEVFSPGADPGLVVAIEPALSDPHHGRRRVAALTFASGLRVVYKPRSIRIEEAFGRLIDRLNPGLDVPLRVPRTLECGTHGWVEFVEPSPAASVEEAARYFRRAGALMCITWMLGARDLHRENLVAAADGPVLIDLELLLQPTTDGVFENEDGATAASCLATGMLSMIEIGPDGEPHDAGGLRGESTGTLPVAARSWRQCGTDALSFDEQTSFSAPRRHELRLGDVVQRPDAYPDDLKAGFADAFRLLIERRAALLAPDGPFEAFAECRVRVLPRPTNQYALAISMLTNPAAQRDGVTAGAIVDVLNRGFAHHRTRPALWPVAVEERRALLALDVPYFFVAADGTRGWSNGRELDVDYFTTSGLAAARRRLTTLTPDDLDAQLALLDRALSESTTSMFLPDLPGPRPSGADALVADAEWIAVQLEARAVRDGDGLVWRYRPHVGGAGWRDHHLYDGTTGTALFFTALAHVTGRDRWRRVADGALVTLRQHLERHPVDTLPASEPIGAGNGLGSIAYGLALAASLRADVSLLDAATSVARGIGPRLTPDGSLDVVNGAAGAALALVALHRVVGDPALLETADACAQVIVDRATTTNDGGLMWPGERGVTLLGVAHGTAGMAWALARVAQATGDAGRARAADRAYAFVRRYYQAAVANWPVAVGNDDAAAAGGTMNGWCHGAPGIAIASLTVAPDIVGALPDAHEPLFRAMAAWQPVQADHVCCGNLARAEALLAAARADDGELLERARTIGRRTVERARRRGHFRLSGTGTDYRVFDPGFFQGLAGIGYELLRLARPRELPSVVAFEMPDSAVRYGSPGAEFPVL